MQPLLHKNRFYFICLGVLFSICAIVALSFQKPELIILVNGNRTEGMDLFFKWATKLGEEPMYLLLATAFLFYRIGYGLLIGLVGFVVMGVSFSLKWLFSIDRPIAFFRKNELLDQIAFIDGVDIHSGATSFPSGHSMSAFALYGLLVFLLPNKKRFAIPLVVLAITVAASRVYLLQHFFVDVFAGGMIGVLVAMLLYIWYDKKFAHANHFLNKPILKTKNQQPKA